MNAKIGDLREKNTALSKVNSELQEELKSVRFTSPVRIPSANVNKGVYATSTTKATKTLLGKFSPPLAFLRFSREHGRIACLFQLSLPHRAPSEFRKVTFNFSTKLFS